MLFDRERVSAFRRSHFGSAVIVLCALTAVCAAQEFDSTIKVDVKLVNVFVTVTDEHGAPVGGLKKDDFILTEDGREQKMAVFDRESELLPMHNLTSEDPRFIVSKS